VVKPPKAILFDWDGTLIDSAEASYRCYVHLFSGYSLPFDRDSFERTYCPDWYRTYVAVGLPRQHWKEADDRWLKLYAEQPPALLPGAREGLDRIARAGLPTGLVTSGQRERVAADLDRLGLSSCFAALVCGSDLPERKPDPAPLRLALSEMNVAAADSAYVGDSPEDVFMARAAGAFSVAVPGGYPNRRELMAANADLFAESLAEALDAMAVER
jgi:HAD superfamily hydrolase (TIGR01549 family)